MIRPFQVASNIGVAETEQVLDRPSICLWVSGFARIRLQPLDRTCLAAMLGRTFPPKCWTSFTEVFRTWFFCFAAKEVKYPIPIFRNRKYRIFLLFSLKFRDPWKLLTRKKSLLNYLFCWLLKWIFDEKVLRSDCVGRQRRHHRRRRRCWRWSGRCRGLTVDNFDDDLKFCCVA